MKMTNAQRSENHRRKSVLASLTLRPMTAQHLAARFPGHARERLPELLSTMAAGGLVHSRPEPQYPGGPTVTVWHPGPRP